MTATLVRIDSGFYRNTPVNGIFTLVSDYKNVRGDSARRKAHRKGLGFITVANDGKSFPNACGRKVRITVPNQNVGYEILNNNVDVNETTSVTDTENHTADVSDVSETTCEAVEVRMEAEMV